MIARRRLVAAGLLLAVGATGIRHARAEGEQRGLGVLKDQLPDDKAFDGFAADAFIRIGTDNFIALIVPNVEMGQGIYTSQAMLIAEELEVGLDQVHVVPAPPDEKLYRQALLGSQTTGGSTSIRSSFDPLRKAGAAVRTMLAAAAAARWQVSAQECRAEHGTIVHDVTQRRLSYGELAIDAAQQPIPRDVTLKPAAEWRLIGTAARRVEGPAKVDGSALFGIDVRIEGMKVAAVRHSPVLGGRVRSIDDSATRGVPGVRDVLRNDNAVAVTADHYWAAKRGLDVLRVGWDGGRNATLATADIVKQLREAFGKVKPVVARHDGDPDGAMSGATRRVEAVYELPLLAHAPMEPINTTIHVRSDGCDVWVGTQVPTVAQQLVAKATGLPTEKIAIHNFLLGGGFGRRLEAESIQQAAEFARQVPYPVKFIWSREEDIQHDLYRPAYYDRISAGLATDGLPVAWIDHISGGSIVAHYFPGGLPEGKLDDDAVEGAKDTPYKLPAVHVDWTRCDPPIPFTWWRGVGPTHNVFVVESFIDELAHAADRDPVEYRRALLHHNPRARAVLDLAAEKAGWGRAMAAGAGRGLSLHDAFGSFLAVVLEVTVAEDGGIRLDRAVAAMDCGTMVNPDTVKAQVEGGLIFGLTAALYSDITLKNGRVEQGNFNDYRMLRMNEAPAIEVHLLASHEPPGGVGETATVSAAPALGNALFAATGKRLRRYPFSRDALRGSTRGHAQTAEQP